MINGTTPKLFWGRVRERSDKLAFGGDGLNRIQQVSGTKVQQFDTPIREHHDVRAF